VRNQLDPHFTLNAINSIIYSVENSDRKLAGEQLRRFAGLYRNLLLRAGVNQITLEEEVDFCRDYLSLEKNRHGDKFCYEITINEDVNRKILVPKFMIQIHVENAIKHGLAPLKSGGILDVKIRNEGNELIIEISDNGIGRQKAAEMKGGSTGKGLKVMDELYRIYNKYYDEKIGSEITDLFDRDGTPSGTRVLIKISTQNEKK
jgi:sensor histidine kinase YesM